MYASGTPMPGAILKEVCFMIHTIIIFTCTVINSAWGFFWIRQIKINYKNDKQKRHMNLCLRCIEFGSCPHNCELCAWGDWIISP